MDKLTTRFQSALQDAQSLAVGKDHQFIEPAHVMAALLDQQDGSTRPLLVKAGANVAKLRKDIDARSTSCRRCRARPATCTCRRI
jgi:ATP-dependent Clp protease ATP-binding subunit ClpB